MPNFSKLFKNLNTFAGLQSGKIEAKIHLAAIGRQRWYLIDKHDTTCADRHKASYWQYFYMTASKSLSLFARSHKRVEMRLKMLSYIQISV